MAPPTTKESFTLIASLSNLVPFLAAAKGVVLLIAEAVDQVGEKNQCLYLLRRCVRACLTVNRICLERRVTDYFGPLDELKHGLDRIQICAERLRKKTPLQRFLQRQEISESVREAHRYLDRSLESFQLQTVLTLAFNAAEHESARQRDQTQLGQTFRQLFGDSADIIEALELRRDQVSDAIRGLRNTISRGIDDVLQRQFANASLKLLLEHQAEHGQFTPYDWAISSLEIFIEGEAPRPGSFGTTLVGRWNGIRVLVRRLARGTSRQILLREIDVWRRIHHPHIVPFFRTCIDATPPLLVSRIYAFGNVMDYLFAFPEANRMNLCHEIALGMVFLHNQRIVHGDLKPANVLIDDVHRARITDFGLYKIKSFRTTQAVGDVLGGVQPEPPGAKVFMAPERLRRGVINYATDVYAFGMTSYQVMTEEPPFQYVPEDQLRQVVVIDRERPIRPQAPGFVARGLTSSMWELIEKCWVNDGEKRPQFVDVVLTLGCLKSGPQVNNDDRRTLTPRPASCRSVRFVETPPPRVRADSAPPLGGRSQLILTALPALPLVKKEDRDSIVSAGSRRRNKLTKRRPETPVQPAAQHASQNNNSRPLSKKWTWSRRLSRRLSGRPASPKQPQSPVEPVSQRRQRIEQELRSTSKSKIRGRDLKIVVVGDAACGKSSLLYAFSQGHFPEARLPTVLETSITQVNIAGRDFELALLDTAPQDEYLRIRQGIYSTAHVFLICFDIGSPVSVNNIQRKWIPELRHVAPNIPFILVGCKKDLRFDERRVHELGRSGWRPVASEEGEAMAEAVGAVCHVECSAFTGDGVQEALRTSAAWGLGILLKEGKHRSRKGLRGCIVA